MCIADQEQIYFIRDLQQQMKIDENKSKVDEFLGKFVEIHNAELRLMKKSMMPTVVCMKLPVWSISP
jgi:hypothetical protein